jgi:hypothetical protein
MDWLGNFVGLNFEFLLVLNHGDVIWDSSKGKSPRKQRRILKHTTLKE